MLSRQCKLSSLALLFLNTAFTSSSHAEVWADVRDNVFSGNSTNDCVTCHHSANTLAERRWAPTYVYDPLYPDRLIPDFDLYPNAAQYATTSAGYAASDTTVGSAAAGVVSPEYMPLDDATSDPAIDPLPYPTDGKDLNIAEKIMLSNWAAQGAPYAEPTATTLSVTNIQKTSVTLRGTVNTNTLNGNAAVDQDGEWYFEWGTGWGLAYHGQVGGDTRNLITATTGTHTFSGLDCGTKYHYRAVSKNGHNTVNGSKVNFTTAACTNPVITEGPSISPAATNEDTSTTFTLNVSDDDAGTLTWDVATQGGKGAFSFDTSTTASPVTVRYTPALDQNGIDNTGQIRITNSATGLTDIINVTMSVTAINDQPVFSVTSIPSTSAIEDTLYSYQLVVDDPDDSFPGGLTAALSNEPVGMSINADGLITWTPMNGVASSGLVTVTVDDGHEDGSVQVMQQFTVLVSATNDPPVITPGATTTATEDVLYQYQVQVTDVDDYNNGTDITFQLSGEPAGMTVSTTGLIEWTPLEGVTTSGLVTVSVEDGDEDVSAPDTESFTITVTQVNDSPVVTAGAPTAMIENADFSYQIVVNDDDDDNNGADLSFTPSNFPAGMSVSTTGLITWTAPRTGADITHSNITVTVADGGEDGATTSAEIFNLAVSIVDTDSDTVADYSDNCPTVSNVGQEDMDNDTVRILPQTDPNNYPPNGDVDPSATDPANALAESYLRGGDACDEDIDGDGMSNDFENSFAFLDPMNAADATADEDGDGVSNLDEFLAGTEPHVDSVGPTVNAPADIHVDATGLLTAVDLGMATGFDGNDGSSTILKAAANLTDDELITLDTPGIGCTALANYEEDIKPFRPGENVVTWATCDSAGNVGRDNQLVYVRPIVSVNSGQSVGEGQSVEIEVVLNGDAIAYPASVSYSVSGTAVAPDDHNASLGKVTFTAPGEVGLISFNTMADGLVESDETVVITLHSPVNVNLGNAKRHTVTITESNLAPKVSLAVTQPTAVLDKKKGHAVHQGDGAVKLRAQAHDGNGDTLSYDWSASDPALLAIATVTADEVDFDPTALAVDTFYNAVVTVSDGTRDVTVQRLLRVNGPQVNAWLVGDDNDGDGIDNLDEGYGDNDGDGIPNYLDHASTPGNAIENHTADLETSVLIETNPGLRIAKGNTAVAANASGIMIGLQDIKDHGGAGGLAVSNADTGYNFISSLLSFDIFGLNESIETVDVVIPLQTAIHEGAVYRKYNTSGWFDFVVDDMNEIRSSAGEDGSCPPPGSNLYVSGLSVGHQCVQLTIQDGGANDADGMRNFVVKDPGGLALAPEPEQAEVATESADGRAGSLSMWTVILMSLLFISLWQLRTSIVVRLPIGKR